MASAGELPGPGHNKKKHINHNSVIQIIFSVLVFSSLWANQRLAIREGKR